LLYEDLQRLGQAIAGAQGTDHEGQDIGQLLGED
jgi:hypothetical protein